MGGLAAGRERWEVVLRESVARDIKKLRKKYPSIDIDLSSAFEKLESDPEMDSDEIPGTNPACRKLRVASSDMKRGKRGGFRVVYAVDHPEPGKIRILIVRPKSEIQHLVASEVNDILKRDRRGS